tara:strand:+ start:90 stop:323 length:234 start_codon:yes stop_codon:yes gene_type:complete
MKLTKAKLQKIIQEELAEITEPSYRFAPKADPDFGNRPEDLEKEVERLKRGRELDRALMDDMERELRELAERHGGRS